MASCLPRLVLLCAAALGAADAAKIIVVPPIMFESHIYIFKTLASALHARGHRTVLLLSEGRDLAPSPHYGLRRYPGVFNSSASDAFLQAKMRSIFSGRPTAVELLDILEQYTRNCDLVLGNRPLLRALRRERFDLLLVDPNDMCGFVIAHLLGVRYAVFSTGLWYPAEVGAPAPLAYVPEFNSLLTDRMSLVQRMKNAGVYLVSRLGVRLLVLPKYERILRKHGLLPGKSMFDLVHGSSLWMLCTDVALEFPRPTLPNVVYVGGILTKPAGPLPQVFRTPTAEPGQQHEAHGVAAAERPAGALAHQGLPEPRRAEQHLRDHVPRRPRGGHPALRGPLRHDDPRAGQGHGHPAGVEDGHGGRAPRGPGDGDQRPQLPPEGPAAVHTPPGPARTPRAAGRVLDRVRPAAPGGAAPAGGRAPAVLLAVLPPGRGRRAAAGRRPALRPAGPGRAAGLPVAPQLLARAQAQHGERAPPQRGPERPVQEERPRPAREEGEGGTAPSGGLERQ
ncbi:2-hydroxyacylsphingosine 1-beta-galactosyltransferase isoform X4 [Phyllostomus hastatus]|uniref:2-hydroxyacylsphingosine 1-beta-galactosyltransferase isoform X4 n=1 Tax=Phyllostomus hastatus TaxID=9423 RepID=UPI001E684646|nr:2-hydroxyacylsphingosine 1-beta-galactosyltransferase isoform X4 [Phyllostomus hastatus]